MPGSRGGGVSSGAVVLWCCGGDVCSTCLTTRHWSRSAQQHNSTDSLTALPFNTPLKFNTYRLFNPPP
ncbi:hypothetical protein E2C01_077627 [Portunus trituberculatus]|uniref:Uncharacterized protein n=1 Tax=Portunus trituberculatus TaxID=210409 RepID=A0A5B7IQ74_PORTR|nr:hypothetical protein [Portunus trituberculatus]